MRYALLFAGALVLIIAGSQLFTNAMEWAGHRMELSHGATGSLLAAVGTALPETIVPIVALVAAAPSADSVATGAVLGAPFLLLTVGVAITGAAVVARRDRPYLTVDPRQARRDLACFLAAFGADIIASALPLPARIAIGVALVVTYAGYARATLRSGVPAEDLPEPLHLLRPWTRGAPPLAAVAAQIALAIAMLIAGSQLFVTAIDDTARTLRFSTLVVALVLVPLATELPETMNSVLWIRTRDDGLAFGNVAGSATFQACILGFIGLTFTSWHPGASGLVSAVPTMLSAAVLLLLLRNGRCRGLWLVAAALPWGGYVLFELLSGVGGPA